MSMAPYIGVMLLGGIFTIPILVAVRIDRAAKLSIGRFVVREGWCAWRMGRHRFNRGGFGPAILRNKCVFQAVATDAAKRTFAIWFQFEHNLLGQLSEIETKLEHADRH